MAQTLSVNNLQFVLDASYRNTHDYGTDPAKFLHSWVIALTNGTGSGNANFAYSDQITIASSSSTTINLYSLTDRFGNAMAPSAVKLFAVRLYSSSDTAATISIGGSTAGNEWLSLLPNSSDLITVRYQGSFIAMCKDATGYAVSNTNKNIKITNNSATQSVVVDVVVVGVK